MGLVRIGISGWRYAPWRGVFYPEGLPQRSELAFAAARFPTIELNGSFYALQRPECYEAWRAATPPGFVFAVKGGRYITHMLKLRGVERALANFFASGVLALGEKLGPLLWQLPPVLAFDRERIARFLDLLPRDTLEAQALARRRDARMKGRTRLAVDAERPLRHAMEVRHPSFADPRFVELLARRGVALVVADGAGLWRCPEALTADHVCVRLHGDKELYASGYTPRALEGWASRIRAWARRRDVYVYFDNDAKVRAPRDARSLMRRLRNLEGTRAAQPACGSWSPTTTASTAPA